MIRELLAERLEEEAACRADGRSLRELAAYLRDLEPDDTRLKALEQLNEDETKWSVPGVDADAVIASFDSTRPSKQHAFLDDLVRAASAEHVELLAD